jgi:transcriptional regulator with XRE-family HTH domain
MKSQLPSVLRQLREKSKITQDELAKNILVTQRVYSSYENGKAEPDIETLIRIAEFYKTSLDFLVGRIKTNEVAEKISNTKRLRISKIKSEIKECG